MPSTVSSIFAAAGLKPHGVVRWGHAVLERRPGVYAVALSDDPRTLPNLPTEAPISYPAVEHLLAVRPELMVDAARPTTRSLASRIASFWFPDEVVLYIGRAGTTARPRALGARIREYYTTPLGAGKPHSGGWFLKTLGNLGELSVHYVRAEDPESAERDMIQEYCRNVSGAALDSVRDPSRPFPFANLEWPKGVRKIHGITGARGELTRPSIRDEA